MRRLFQCIGTCVDLRLQTCHWREGAARHLMSSQTDRPVTKQAESTAHSSSKGEGEKVAPILEKQTAIVGCSMGLGYITNSALANKRSRGSKRKHSACLFGIHLTGELTAASYLQPNRSAILLTMLSWKHYRKCVCQGSVLLYQFQTAGTHALSTTPGFQQWQTTFQKEKKKKRWNGGSNKISVLSL